MLNNKCIVYYLQSLFTLYLTGTKTASAMCQVNKKNITCQTMFLHMNAKTGVLQDFSNVLPSQMNLHMSKIFIQ